MNLGARFCMAMRRGAQSSGFLEAEAAVSWNAPPPPEPSYVLFEVHAASTEMGDTLVLVGSTDRLGNWEVKHGVRLCTSPARYPVWYAWLPGCLPGCEFKFVIARRGGEHNEWEPGGNRRLPPQATRVAATFGIAQAIISTAESDSELFRLREALAAPAERVQSLSAGPVVGKAGPPVQDG